MTRSDKWQDRVDYGSTRLKWVLYFALPFMVLWYYLGHLNAPIVEKTRFVEIIKYVPTYEIKKVIEYLPCTPECLTCHK